MPDSLCRVTIAACTEDAHRAVDLALPAGMHIDQLLPQIVDILQPAGPVSDWRLCRLGDPPMDESMTLNDNAVRDGEVLILTTSEPPVAEWAACDPCRAMVSIGPGSAVPVPRMFPAICGVVVGGFGAAALAWAATGNPTAGDAITGTLVAATAAAAAAVVRRLNGDPLISVPLSLIAVLYAGVVGFLAVPPGPPASGLLMAFAATFSASILLLRVTGCGRTCLTAVATLSVLTVAVAAVGATWELQLQAGGAALATLSLATLGFAPRLAMLLCGAGPSTPSIDDQHAEETDAVTPNAGRCQRTLTGLVVGSSIAATVGAASVAADIAGPALRDLTFTAVVALVLLLRGRTHVHPHRRIGLVVTAVLTAAAGFAAATVSAPAQAHVVSVLAAASGAAALGFLIRPKVSPVVSRIVEVVEYLAIAAVVPVAAWVAGIYGLARGVNLI
ncbi:type VII secretion integral membrane protein EccD [Mycobacterium sp. 2YAF39]|uniref:type VII secretion integral membrane protein EccD n=1 Tax=Mycobacterium sp. 2YAF39 TaxID=3233033 RepID=UPI003F9A67F3